MDKRAPYFEVAIFSLFLAIASLPKSLDCATRVALVGVALGITMNCGVSAIVSSAFLVVLCGTVTLHSNTRTSRELRHRDVVKTGGDNGARWQL